MAATTDVTDHYASGSLLERLDAALRDDGVDPARPDMAALAHYDHFHGRGLEATEELAARLSIAASDHLLDVGSGIGGPARYLANRFGCRVTGVDLTDEFCAVARVLNRRAGLDARVTIERGNALAMPFDAGTFDGAHSMNVSMNIEDKAALYREIHRVLRPGGWLVLSEVAAGPGPGSVEYPPRGREPRRRVSSRRPRPPAPGSRPAALTCANSRTGPWPRSRSAPVRVRSSRAGASRRTAR